MTRTAAVVAARMVLLGLLAWAQALPAQEDESGQSVQAGKKSLADTLKALKAETGARAKSPPTPPAKAPPSGAKSGETSPRFVPPTVVGSVSEAFQGSVEALASDKVDAAFVIDTTGSMGPHVANVQRHLATVLRDLEAQKRSVRCGMVAYRDRRDVYVSRVVSGLTRDLPALQQQINTLSANGGGDGPEDVLTGLLTAAKRLTWRRGVERVIFLVGDAPPHLDYPNLTVESTVRTLKSKNIKVFAVDCTSVPFFRDIAMATDGHYIRLRRGGAPAPAVLVYVRTSRSRSKTYHRAECKYVRKRKKKRAIRLEEAKALGYRPCKKCRPPE